MSSPDLVEYENGFSEAVESAQSKWHTQRSICPVNQPEMSYFLEVLDEIYWLQNSLGVRISCSTQVTHWWEIYFFHSCFILSLHRTVCEGHRYCLSCPRFMFLNFSFYYSAVAGLFKESNLASPLKDAWLSGQQEVCVMTLLSLC